MRTIRTSTLSRSLWLLAASLIGCTHHPPSSSSTTASATLSTTLLTPDGHPAAGALAVLAPAGHFVSVADGRSFDDDPAYARATADAAGRLHLTPTTRPSLLAVIHPAGTAYVTDDALSSLPPALRLTPWSRIEGRRLIGPNPAPDHAVVAWADRGESDPYDPRIPSVRYLSHARTDPAGRYLLDHLPPGEVHLAPDDPMTWGPSISRPLLRVDLRPGQTATANLGGHGRIVEGRITVPSDLPAPPPDRLFYLCMLSAHVPPVPSPLPPELEQQSPAAQSAWWDRFNQTPAGHAYHAAERARIATIQSHTYPFDVRPDGTYRVDDVPPGEYDLYLQLRTPPAPGQKPTRKVGECKLTFVVPPSAGSAPFAAPPATVAPLPLVDVGDPAPDFTVPALNGDKPLTLSSFRGKYVLLHFWATWCGPCLGELPQIKAAHDAFANDPRFTIISLSFDPSPDLPTRYAATHHLDWPHGFLGDMTSSPVAARWGVTAIPSLWLIAPDGRVLKKDLHADTLRPDLARVLSAAAR